MNTRTSCWSAQVTGVESTEGVVTHTRVHGFVVLPNLPVLRVQKTVDVLSDPVSGAVNRGRFRAASNAIV